jgi:hypothetical protein
MKIQIISKQILEANLENLQIWISKFFFMSWSDIQVQIGASCLNFINSWCSNPIPSFFIFKP